jgi:hypothetical protein
VAGEGKSPPPLDWIDAAAGVLGARPAWLAFGEGRPTKGEEERLRERFTSFLERFGRPDPHDLVVVVGTGEDAVLDPDRVVLIDGSTVPDDQRAAYVASLICAVSEVPLPTE